MSDKPTVFNYHDYLALKKRIAWIPVSEKLPEVIPYNVDGCEWEESNDVLICDKNGNMYVATYEVDGETRQYWVDAGGQQFKDVTAWMLLPEPYRGEK